MRRNKLLKKTDKNDMKSYFTSLVLSTLELLSKTA